MLITVNSARWGAEGSLPGNGIPQGAVFLSTFFPLGPNPGTELSCNNPTSLLKHQERLYPGGQGEGNWTRI